MAIHHPRLFVALTFVILAFAGCGGDSGTNPVDDSGSGNEGPRLESAVLTGRVEVPAGVQVARVSNSLGDAEVAGGDFALTVFTSGRQFATATSATGQPMLMGWLGEGASTLSSRTTVEVLLFYAVGAFALPSDAQVRAIDLLAAMPELDALAAQWVGLLETDVDAIGTAPAAFVAALESLVDDLTDDALEREATSEATEAFAALARGVVVDGESRSGLRIDTVEGINSITLTNTYRRLCHAFVERVATVDEDGIVTPDPAPLTDFEMPAVQGLGSTLGTFIDIIYGRFAYEERSAQPVELPTVEGAARTRYRLTVVGAGLSNGDLSLLTPTQLSKQESVVQTFVVRDLVLPLILSVLIPNSDLDTYLDFVGGANVVQDFVGIMTRELPGIWDQAYEGDVVGALLQAYNAIVTGGTLRDQIFERVFDLVADLEGPGAASQVMEHAGVFVRVMTALDMFLAVFDATVVGSAITLSDRANVWQIDVTEPKIRLTPEDASVAFDGTQDFTVTVPEASGSGANLVYEWSTQGNFGTLRDGIAGHVNSFDSSRDVATYTADQDAPGTDMISVEVFVLSGPGQSERQSIGTATATVQVTPGIVSIAPTATQIRGGDEAEFTVTTDPAPPGAEFVYSWWTSGDEGSLDVGVDRSTATYRARFEGDGEDEVQVTVRQRVNGDLVSWGTTTATVDVGPLQPWQTASRLYETLGDGQQEGFYSYTFVWGYVFEHIEGARRYELMVTAPSGNPESLLEVGDVRVLSDPDSSGSSRKWHNAETLTEAYGSNVLGLGENEICYLWSWRPTTNWDLDSINENLPIWQARVGGDLQLVWAVRPLD